MLLKVLSSYSALHLFDVGHVLFVTMHVDVSNAQLGWNSFYVKGIVPIPGEIGSL